jgi:glycosyltransferase involved in cell wall biosynthesis
LNSKPTSFCSIAQFEALELKTIKLHFPEILDEFYFFHAPKLSDRGKVFAVFQRFFDLRKKNRGKKCIYVTHELSEAPLHWRLRQWILMLLSDFVVTHTKNDMVWVKKWLIASKRKHIPSFLSPPIAPPYFKSPEERAQFKLKARTDFAVPKNLKNTHWILFNGLFTQDKGIEYVIELARMNPDLLFIFAGSILPTPKDSEYGKKLITSIEKLQNALMLLDLDSETLSRLILSSDAVVLPYRHGLSERRSSFKVPYTHGVPVLTTFGPWTPAEWLHLPGVYGVYVDATQSDVTTNLPSSLNAALQTLIMTSPETRLKQEEFQSQYALKSSMESRIKAIFEQIRT